MEWVFKCPLCDKKCRIDWDFHEKKSTCPHCEEKRPIPGPKDQHSAYVDQHDWPEEMKEVVLKLKGKNCIIKGCDSNEITLDHIIAYENRGKTSVDNLQPMCQSHNSSKGTKDFSKWMEDNKYSNR